MRQFAVIVGVAATMGSLFPQPIRAEQIPPCPPPAGVTEQAFPTEVPIGVRKALRAKIGEDIAAPGERFNATDAHVEGDTAKNVRAIFAWARGHRWVIATERGGIGYNDPVFAFTATPDGAFAAFSAEAVAFPKAVCTTATSLIALP